MSLQIKNSLVLEFYPRVCHAFVFRTHSSASYSFQFKTEGNGKKNNKYFIRAILILNFIRNPYFAYSQVLPLGSLVSELFLFLLYNLSFPCGVGTFFWLQLEFQWENDQNKKNSQKSLFRGPKWFPKCLNGGFRGVFVLKSGLRILIRAPQVPFLVPPKTPILGVFG